MSRIINALVNHPDAMDAINRQEKYSFLLAMVMGIVLAWFIIVGTYVFMKYSEEMIAVAATISFIVAGALFVYAHISYNNYLKRNKLNENS